MAYSSNYDVFLSFRGEDTRYNFTSHLYDALCRNNIKAFIDYNIDIGDEITPALERVIEGAKISIIVFSKNYAESTYCLDELVMIMECRETKAQIVLPIFYKVEPLEVTCEEAFARHEANNKGKKRCRGDAMKQGMKKVERWKSAFRKALQLAGWPVFENSNEVEIIRKITKEVSVKLSSSQSKSKGETRISISIVGKTAEDNYQEILQLLMDDETSRVGVHGMGGVGKTTIATHIYNQLLELPNSFGRICWVTVSKDSSIYILQSKIAKSLNLDLSDEDDECERAAKLWKELERIDKFLVILDDVWEPYEMEDVGIPLSNNGRKLLLTTRHRRVCVRMECQPIQVNPLSKCDSLDLFKKECKHQIKDSSEWQGLVESVVAECAGLPLAIIVMARRMRGVVEICEWRDVLRVLKKPCEWKNREMEEKVFKPLKFSYDSLLDGQYRQCLLYISLFPEDYSIGCDILIDVLIGEGLIDKLDYRQEELDRGNVIINELVNASLLEVWYDGEKNLVKMHDMVRDMALIVIRENSKAHDGSKLQGLSQETERCLNLENVQVMKYPMLQKAIANLASNCPKLTTLFIHGFQFELPSGVFANMQNLVVLKMGPCSLKFVPNSLSNLGNLRVLDLGGCFQLEYIPSLAGLKNLRFLDLYCTNLKEIPNGMDRLINLCLLRLTWDQYSPVAFFPCAFLEKLSHLQILEFENDVEPGILISLEKLKTLKIVFYNLESLTFYLKSDHWWRLEKYFIAYTPTKKRITYGYWDDKTCTKAMYFEEFRALAGQKGELDISLPPNIERLQLKLWNGLMADVLMKSTFDNLLELYIYGCESKNLFTPTSAQQVLRNVEILYIWGDEVEEIISSEEEFEGQINSTTYTTIVLPKLKTLTLDGSTNLTSIYKGKMACPLLERITIVKCGKLERLPFWMEEERNQENRRMIQLGVIQPFCKGILCSGYHSASSKWWDSLQWDDFNAKSRYQLDLGGCFLERSKKEP